MKNRKRMKFLEALEDALSSLYREYEIARTIDGKEYFVGGMLNEYKDDATDIVIAIESLKDKVMQDILKERGKL
jgi:argonaute-like protein implicated in RNA metabolism and viral defense